MYKIIPCFLFLVFSVNLQAQTMQEQAIAYNDLIINEQNKVGEVIVNYSNALNAEEFTVQQLQLLQDTYSSLLKQANISSDIINNLPVFDGNIEFSNACKALFQFYVAAIQNEYKMILDYMGSPEPSAEQEEILSKAIESMSSREQLIDAQFANAQQAFALKYGFTLSENELQNAIDGD